MHDHLTGRLGAAAGALLLLVMLAGCTSAGGTTGHARETSAADGSRPEGGDTTAAALTYGAGPVEDRSVTYQSDVVLVEGGAGAIRSASPDGLTWTIDGQAAGASDVEVGKVMYVTSRAVGRVVRIRPEGGDLAVTLAPVSLTEVFRDAHFHTDRKIDPSATLYQEVPDRPGAVSVPAGAARSAAPSASTAAFTARPAALTRNAGAVVSLGRPRFVSADADRLPPARENSVTWSHGGWEVQPESSPGELGLKIGHEAGDGLKAFIDFSLHTSDLRVRSDVSISNGRMGSGSTFVVEGVDGFSIDISAGAANGADDNKKVRVEVPVELTVPVLPGEPLMYSNTWKFVVGTALSGKNTTVTAGGTWRLDGPLGIVDGKLVTPRLTVVKPIMDSIGGVSVGVSGVAAAVEAKFQLGLGIPAAFAGPYAKFVMDTGVANGSALGSARPVQIGAAGCQGRCGVRPHGVVGGTQGTPETSSGGREDRNRERKPEAVLQRFPDPSERPAVRRLELNSGGRTGGIHGTGPDMGLLGLTLHRTRGTHHDHGHDRTVRDSRRCRPQTTTPAPGSHDHRRTGRHGSGPAGGPHDTHPLGLSAARAAPAHRLLGGPYRLFGHRQQTDSAADAL
ncbi:hypothetical protein [Streptomyces sp. NPDC058891]|uniref:hypothetical protein n=1 Tax=unclassified Streptomyces TaxID=2593676 RepID=UPI0036C202F7